MLVCRLPYALLPNTTTCLPAAYANTRSFTNYRVTLFLLTSRHNLRAIDFVIDASEQAALSNMRLNETLQKCWRDGVRSRTRYGRTTLPGTCATKLSRSIRPYCRDISERTTRWKEHRDMLCDYANYTRKGSQGRKKSSLEVKVPLLLRLPML